MWKLQREKLMRTWSGQDEKDAWHWCHETNQKLGNVIYLIATGTAANRTKAYDEFIDLKRWFLVEEFDACIENLDTYRKSRGAKPLLVMIEEIYKEKNPATDWKAKDGFRYADTMPEEYRRPESTNNEALLFVEKLLKLLGFVR
jgi:hypothetical protein